MINRIDEYRKQYGFYTVDEIISEVALENVVFDPYSLLISKSVHIGKDNIFYSNIISSLYIMYLNPMIPVHYVRIGAVYCFQNEIILPYE